MHATAEPRSYPRQAVRERALVRVGGSLRQAIVVDVGLGGMRIEHIDLQVDDVVKIYVATSRSSTEPMVVLSGIVRWTVGRVAGIAFNRVDERSSRAVARLIRDSRPALASHA